LIQEETLNIDLFVEKNMVYEEPNVANPLFDLPGMLEFLKVTKIDTWRSKSDSIF
jgi:hypothetical protein